MPEMESRVGRKYVQGELSMILNQANSSRRIYIESPSTCESKTVCAILTPLGSKIAR
jgi:hypothetical protein